MKIVKTDPLFELYIENDLLIINNTQHSKGNEHIEIKDIESLELIRELSLWNKVIEQTFGFLVPAKSERLRIRFENSFKDIALTNCDIKKVESLIYEMNLLIIKTENHNP